MLLNFLPSKFVQREPFIDTTGIKGTEFFKRRLFWLTCRGDFKMPFGQQNFTTALPAHFTFLSHIITKWKWITRLSWIKWSQFLILHYFYTFSVYNWLESRSLSWDNIACLLSRSVFKNAISTLTFTSNSGYHRDTPWRWLAWASERQTSCHKSRWGTAIVILPGTSFGGNVKWSASTNAYVMRERSLFTASWLKRNCDRPYPAVSCRSFA